MNISFKLMLKTHTTTGMNYLCMTKRTEWEKYTGSGTYWLNHLKAHGKKFTTILLLETESYSDFLEAAAYYSTIFDVVDNPMFANSIPEAGYDNQHHGRSNLEIWWDIATDEKKAEVFNIRRKALIDNGKHWAYSENRANVIKSISNSQHKLWYNLSIEEQNERINRLQNGFSEFISDQQRVENWKKKLSLSMISVWNNMTELERQNRGSNISIGRLSMTQENKQLRAERISHSFKNSEKRINFVNSMRENRKGVSNPAAKIFLWFGEEYTSEQFKALIRAENIQKQYRELMFSTRSDCKKPEIKNIQTQILTCPHCGEQSNPLKSHSGFKKWHLNNCRKKAKHEN